MEVSFSVPLASEEDLGNKTFVSKFNKMVIAFRQLAFGGITAADNMTSIMHEVSVQWEDINTPFPFALDWPWTDVPAMHGECTHIEALDGGKVRSSAMPLWDYDGSRIIVRGIACVADTGFRYKFRLRFFA